MKNCVSIVLLLALSPFLAAQTVEKRPVSFTDLLSVGSAVTTLDLSPDGNALVYTAGRQDIWLVNTRSAWEPRKIAKGFLPIWSPSGEDIAFYSVGPDGIQLWRFNIGTTRAVQITYVSGGIDPDPNTRLAGYVHDAFRFSWAPDGRRLVFASRITLPVKDGMHTQPLILTSTTPPDWTLSGVFAHEALGAESSESKDGRSITAKTDSQTGKRFSNQLFVADITKKLVSRLTNDDKNYFHPAWRPNGKSVASVSSDEPVALSKAANIVEIDIQSGRQKHLTDGLGLRFHPAWNMDGRSIAFLSQKNIGALVSLSVKEADDIRNMTGQFDRSVDRFAWEFGNNSILITYPDGASHVLGRVNTASGSLELNIVRDRPESRVQVGQISTSRAGNIAWVQSDAMFHGSLRVLRADSPSTTHMLDLYPQIQHWKLGTVEQVQWKNKRGDDMEGALLKPVNYESGIAYPLIVDLYPQTNGTQWLHPMMGNQAWASMGYAVFRPHPRAPHTWMNKWKSESFDAAAKGKYGWDVTIDDVLSGVDELTKRGIIDPQRMCLYGFSNGATVVDYVITQTDRFKCAVSVAGSLSDWIGPALLSTGGAAYLQTLSGVTLWDDPEAYVRLSAVFFANKVTTPVLLAAGDNDGGFLLGTIRMYNALRHAKADVTMLRYSGQEHGFEGEAMVDFWQRETAFFSKYLEPNTKNK